MARLLAVFAMTVLASGQVFKPLSVDFASLRDGADSNKILGEALATDGVVAIKGIPDFARFRTEALHGAHSCIVTSPNAQSQEFLDGTMRHSLAGVSTSKGHEAIDHGSTSLACRNWERTSQTFRKTVAGAIDLFTKRLSSLLDVKLQSGTGHSYNNLEEVVNAGDRLEHFHTYAVPSLSSSEGNEPIIDYHIDQGIFIAFAPAMLVDATAPAEKSLPTGSFMIKSKTGVELEADFDGDSLVILLGDGVNQYMNHRRAGLALHAPVHAFRMPRGLPAGLHRVWYGLMQLPPSDAKSDDTGLTFGEIRAKVIGTPRAPLGLGCSRELSVRELSSTSCAANQLYCWHRCMNMTTEVSPTACAAKSMDFNCTSQFDQIYREQDGHGDYNLACTNAKEFIVPRPPVVQPTDTCNGWQALVSDTSYTHRAELVKDETYFLWNIVGNKLEGKMIHKGMVGWMAIGAANVGGKRKGMNGGRVVMGLNDPSSSPSVGEYKVHEKASAFRHWKEPLSSSTLEDASMTLTGCFSYIKFKTDKIYGYDLNVTQGENHLIWALTHLAYPTSEYGGYAAYHASVDSDRSKRPSFRGAISLIFNSDTYRINNDQNNRISKAATGITINPLVLSCALMMLGAILSN